MPIHKLHFLLDMGLDTNVPEIKAAVEQIKAHRDENGVYQSLTNVPKHYGGTGTDIFAWCLCDAPLLLSALIKAGCDYESEVKQGVEYLITIVRENGFPCAVSRELGKFHGPGSKGELCPNATLQMLKLLSLIPEQHNSPAASCCISNLLRLWAESETRHPFQFYMGTDFRKLKAPMIWYDIVSVVNCLSHFEQARQDSRFKEMLAIIEQKQDKDGQFVPEAVFLKYKAWEFGQKKKRERLYYERGLHKPTRKRSNRLIRGRLNRVRRKEGWGKDGMTAAASMPEAAAHRIWHFAFCAQRLKYTS